jgi:hypothetical protein
VVLSARALASQKKNSRAMSESSPAAAGSSSKARWPSSTLFPLGQAMGGLSLGLSLFSSPLLSFRRP